MATYTANVKGGFWETNGVGSLGSVSGESGSRRDVRHALGEKGMMSLRAIWDALTGAAPGVLATKNYTQVSSSQELGGVRAIETVPLVNRVTTAADVTEIKSELLRFYDKNTFGANPPPNLDRNPLGTR